MKFRGKVIRNGRVLAEEAFDFSAETMAELRSERPSVSDEDLVRPAIEKRLQQLQDTGWCAWCWVEVTKENE